MDNRIINNRMMQLLGELNKKIYQIIMKMKWQEELYDFI